MKKKLTAKRILRVINALDRPFLLIACENSGYEMKEIAGLMNSELRQILYDYYNV